jgi:hypothetical protein
MRALRSSLTGTRGLRKVIAHKISTDQVPGWFNDDRHFLNRRGHSFGMICLHLNSLRA